LCATVGVLVLLSTGAGCEGGGEQEQSADCALVSSIADETFFGHSVREFRPSATSSSGRVRQCGYSDADALTYFVARAETSSDIPAPGVPANAAAGDVENVPDPKLSIVIIRAEWASGQVMQQMWARDGTRTATAGVTAAHPLPEFDRHGALAIVRAMLD
jgi:hypothetical protein